MNTLSPNKTLQWINETPMYRTRWNGLSVDEKRAVLAQPITLEDVRSADWMMSIFDKAEDIVAEREAAIEECPKCSKPNCWAHGIVEMPEVENYAA